jgi:hypothetical protein
MSRSASLALASAFVLVGLSAGCRNGGGFDGTQFFRRGGGEQPLDRLDRPPVGYTDPGPARTQGQETYTLLNSSDADARARAARQLGRTGDASALPTLRQAAEGDPDRDVRREAARAVDRIRDRNSGGRGFGSAGRAYGDSYNMMVR